MDALMLQPNGTCFGGWLLNTADNHGLGKVSATRMPASFGQTVQITADGAVRQISAAHAALSAVTHCATIGHQ